MDASDGDGLRPGLFLADLDQVLASNGLPVVLPDAAEEAAGEAGEAGGVGKPVRILLLPHEGEVRAFINACPHFGAPLHPDHLPPNPERPPWNFFTGPDRDKIRCCVHGALFRTHDGFCESGDCAGESLTPVSVEVREGRILLAGPILRTP